MSHFVVMVIGDNPEEQLERYHACIYVEEEEIGFVSEEDKQDMINFYIKGEWDHCRLGGRWSGRFIRLKPGASGTIGEPDAFNNEAGCDAAKKRDIDFDSIFREAKKNAIRKYQRIMENCKGQIPHLKIYWRTFFYSKEYAHLSLIEKINLYNDQNSVKLWHALNKQIPLNDLSLEEFQYTEEEYAERSVINAFIPFAFIHEGEWYKQGDFSWSGINLSENSNDKWQKKVWDLVNSLSDDTLISFYDCHI